MGANLGSPDSLQRLLLHPLHVGCLIHVLLPQLDRQAAGAFILEPLFSELCCIPGCSVTALPSDQSSQPGPSHTP